MVVEFLKNLFSSVAQIGVERGDPDEIRLQKTLLVSIASAVIVAAILWGAIYYISGEFLAASIPLSYAFFSTLSIVIFAVTRHYRFFRFSQLLLILLLPFLLMVSLGGFVNSSAVVLWSLLCPLGALLFSEPRRAFWWFLAYLGLVIAGGLLQPYVRATNNLSSTVKLMFFVMNIGAVSTIVFVMLNYFLGQKNSFLKLLRVEQDKSERLLLNILPREIAEILKVENRIIADQFENASIMFADLVEFTQLTAELAPVEMVELLNEIYLFFDDLVEKYGLEKIRTIGDNYMVVSGVPRRRPDHAQALANMALEMYSFLEGFKTKTGKRLQYRIGINSGPLVAGVVGRKKFQYDVWGDAVNIASRMESHGVPGKVHITGTTRELVKDEFICEPRGTVRVKGKGQMETWFLMRRKLETQMA